MTVRPDAELVALFCERVLGWHRGAYGDWFDSADKFVRSAIYPLHSLDDAFAGLRAHAEWKVEIKRCTDGIWLVYIVVTLNETDDIFYGVPDPDLCRAIVLASLMACGCDV